MNSNAAQNTKFRLIALMLLTFICSNTLATNKPPFADIHIHWKYNQKEVTTVKQAVDILHDNNIQLAVVIGSPAKLALELAAAAPDKVIPIFSVYQIPGSWSMWHRDKTLIERTREALASGQYHGIGEIHMIGGFISDWKKPTIKALFELAAEFDVPVLVHTEFSRANYTVGFCQEHPNTRFLWAHAGSMLKPSEVDRALTACPNLYPELSARDPWRHTANNMSDQQGKLKPEWRHLIIKYADRFMVGSDAVWPVEKLNPWDEADSGWQKLGDFIDFHNQWLDTLPSDFANKVRYSNAKTFWKSR